MFLRLAPFGGELPTKEAERGWEREYAGFKIEMGIFLRDYGYLSQYAYTQLKIQYVRRRAPLRPLASSPPLGVDLS